MKESFSNTARKALRKMDRAVAERILAGIDGLHEIPPKGDIKEMQGSPAGRRRLRVGGYRVIYRISEDTLEILDIGPRGDIYK